MSESYKLLIDTNTSIVEPLVEESNSDSDRKLYVQGIFGQAGKKNKNGRVYDFEEMAKELERFNKEVISEGRGLNELNHPSTPDINLERCCDRTVSLSMDKDGVIYGKALVMEEHPMGRIEKAILDSGGKIGKSSRAMGQVAEARDDTGSACNYVTGLKLVCWDSVQDPSVGSAIVDPLLEQKEWIVGTDGSYLLQPLENLEKSIATLPKHDKEQYFIESVQKFFKEVKF